MADEPEEIQEEQQAQPQEEPQPVEEQPPQEELQEIPVEEAQAQEVPQEDFTLVRVYLLKGPINRRKLPPKSTLKLQTIRVPRTDPTKPNILSQTGMDPTRAGLT